MVASFRRGNLLLGLTIALTIVGLTALTAFLQKSTLLVRVREDDLKFQLDALRLSMDLYKKRASLASVTTLVATLNAQNITPGLDQLFREGYLRKCNYKNPVLDSNPQQWQYHKNYVYNSGFEWDDPAHIYKIGLATSGNSLANDLVPNGWEVASKHAFQVVKDIKKNTAYVASFWVRADPATHGKCFLEVSTNTTVLATITQAGEKNEWRRYFAGFVAPNGPNTYSVVLKIGQNSTAVGQSARFDGVQVEESVDPANPFPSIWTADGELISNQPASTSLKQIFFNRTGGSAVASAGAITIRYGHW